MNLDLFIILILVFVALIGVALFLRKLIMRRKDSVFDRYFDSHE